MNTPADTLAALAADIERAGQTAPFILDNTAFAISPSEIDGWVSRLRALASLKGEAVAEIESVGDRYGTNFTHATAIIRVYNGYVPKCGDKFYTSPPAPQAVKCKLCEAGTPDGLCRAAAAEQALTNRLSVAPSPAPQGGGEVGIPHWALPSVENALNLLDHYGFMHTDLAAVRDWLKERT